MSTGFPTDEQIEKFKQTQIFDEWMMENAGNGDWVEFEERNYDSIVEMAAEWIQDNSPASPDGTEETSNARP